MPLKAILDKLDGLADALRALYVEKDGKFVLDVEGMVPEADLDAAQTKLAEFRTNNRTLKSELDTLKDKYGDLDPVKVKTSLEELEALRKKGVKDPADLDTQIAKAVAAAIKPIQDQLEAEQTERKKAADTLAARDRDSALWAVAEKAGVEPWAKDDYLRRANAIAKAADNGEIVVFNGDSPVFSKRRGHGGDPMTLDEWAREVLPKEAPGLFKDNKGTGEGPGKKGVPSGGGGKVIAASDAEGISRNLEAIASGKATIASGE